MGRGCRGYERSSDLDWKIETPQIGDVLTTRTEPLTGEKVLVCKNRSIIACISTGDRLRIEAIGPNFRRKWKVPRIIEATFNMDGEERFVLDVGGAIRLADCNRRMNFAILSLAEKRHNEAEPVYSPDVVNTMLATEKVEPPVLVGV